MQESEKQNLWHVCRLPLPEFLTKSLATMAAEPSAPLNCVDAGRFAAGDDYVRALSSRSEPDMWRAEH